jgi:hypothetical protein
MICLGIIRVAHTKGHQPILRARASKQAGRQGKVVRLLLALLCRLVHMQVRCSARPSRQHPLSALKDKVEESLGAGGLAIG